jgi:hypothetical protein
VLQQQKKKRERKESSNISWGCWYLPITLVLRRPRQEDSQFEAILGYTVSSRATWATYQDPVSNKTKQKAHKAIIDVISQYIF